MKNLATELILGLREEWPSLGSMVRRETDTELNLRLREEWPSLRNTDTAKPHY